MGRVATRFPNWEFRRRGACALLTAILSFGLARPSLGQQSAATGQPVSLVRDWSSKHVLFTNGASPDPYGRGDWSEVDGYIVRLHFGWRFR